MPIVLGKDAVGHDALFRLPFSAGRPAVSYLGSMQEATTITAGATLCHTITCDGRGPAGYSRARPVASYDMGAASGIVAGLSPSTVGWCLGGRRVGGTVR